MKQSSRQRRQGLARTVPGQNRHEVTLREVAKRAAVSEMTVSRVIRKQGYVADKTRELVLKAAADLGYVPNQIAGALASRSTNLIAIVVPTLTNQVYAEVMAGIHEALHGTRYQPVFGISDYDQTREQTLIHDMLAWRPSGLVVSGNNQSAGARKLMRNASIPIVQIMEYIKRPLHYCVGIAHDEVGKAVAEHLLERGYRTIAYIGNDLERDVAAKRRFEAFAEVIKATGLRLAVLTVPELASSNTLGGELTKQILAAHPKIDAIHYANDTLAIGGVLHCLKHSISIPAELAICGYVGLETVDSLPVTMSTVRIPRREIGELAGRYLLDQLQSPSNTKSKSIKMPFTLVTGVST